MAYSGEFSDSSDLSDFSDRFNVVNDSDGEYFEYDKDHLPRSGQKLIAPYQFEPEYDSDDPAILENLLEADDDVDWRLQDDSWCQCGNCQRMPTADQCKCCIEVNAVADKLRGVKDLTGSDFTCITDTPAFSSVCLDHWVLQAAWIQYKTQYGRQAFDGPSHKKNRHIAYRQLARWCWGFLGKDIRVPLPACCVSRIRAKFPPPGLEQNPHFEGFRWPGE